MKLNKLVAMEILKSNYIFLWALDTNTESTEALVGFGNQNVCNRKGKVAQELTYPKLLTT